MAYCSNCGKPLYDGANYCPNCGIKIRFQDGKEAKKAGYDRKNTDKQMQERNAILRGILLVPRLILKIILTVLKIVLFIPGLILSVFGIDILGDLLILGAATADEAIDDVDDAFSTITNKYTVSPNEVIISRDMVYYEKMNFDSMIKVFESAGFENISAVPLNDLKRASHRKKGIVERITVNGESDFEVKDIYDKRVPVIITYHSVKQ